MRPYDGRWGQVPLPEYKDIEGIHSTFGLYTLLIFPAFVHYAFQREPLLTHFLMSLLSMRLSGTSHIAATTP